MPFESPEVKLHSSKTFIFIFCFLSLCFGFLLEIALPLIYALPLNLLLIAYSVQVMRTLVWHQFDHVQLLTASLWRVNFRNRKEWLILKIHVFRSAWLLSLQGRNLSTGKKFTLLIPRDSVKPEHYDQLLYTLF